MVHAPAAAAQAGSPPSPPARAAAPAALESPVPQPPATVARDAAGRATVRAVRLSDPLRVDGRLDESLYTTAVPASDFIQIEPNDGAPATEKTDVWVSFDREHVYVTVRAWESQPERMIVNEMRRDSQNILQNENFAFLFDTFHDRRNGVLFNVTPSGGRMDGQVTNETQYNGDWNPIWDLAVGRFDGGWTAEAALPFKSLRYRPGRDQVWGFNGRRINRWKNEISYLTPMPQAQGIDGIFQASQAATLVGLEVPGGTRSFDVKPYVISDLSSQAVDSSSAHHVLRGDYGLDVKTTLSQGLTADLTYNTDFAQVEADEQQVNLTRFSLFFPEKREFFLENQGLFQFGGSTGSADVPVLFYSRRIGLDEGRAIPIQGGGRLTGRLGAFSLGLVDIRTGEDRAGSAPTNFSVVRLKRDLLRRSSVGVLFARRSVALGGPGASDTYGADGAFAFFDNLVINTYWARTRTGGRTADDTSHRLQLRYEGDRYGLALHHLMVGDDFNPEVGFAARAGINREFAQFRFSPRPASIEAVRKFSFQGQLRYIEDLAGRLESRDLEGRFAIEFENSDRFELRYSDSHEFLTDPFRIATGVSIPTGSYDFGTLRAGITLGQQRPASGELSVERGSFYGGHKTVVAFNQGRLEVTPQLSIEPGVSLNRISLPFGSFTTNLVSSRVTYAMTPLMFVSGLLQYNSRSHSLDANVRLRWEYRPGSELFVVVNETRDTGTRGFPAFQGRAIIVKVNRLFRL